MHIRKLIINGFRCFDNAGATLNLDDFTCLIGANAAGKTSAMQAIVKLFGETASLRQITSSDFHLGINEKLIDKIINNKVDFAFIANYILFCLMNLTWSLSALFCLMFSSRPFLRR